MSDHISGFKGGFDYDTILELVAHLREHSSRVAGGSAGDCNYDPETLVLESDAADALQLLKTARDFEKAACLEARSVISRLEAENLDLRSELQEAGIQWSLRAQEFQTENIRLRAEGQNLHARIADLEAEVERLKNKKCPHTIAKEFLEGFK